MTPSDDLDDALLDALAHLDPTTADAPPEPGSSRHRTILEHAMTWSDTSLSETSLSETSPPMTDLDDRRSRRRRRLVGAAAAVAAAIIAVTAIVVFEPGRDPEPVSAREALTTAATTTGRTSSLRAEGTYDSGSEPPTHLTGEIDGSDYTSTFRRVGPDGEEHVSSHTHIGSTLWEVRDGEVTKTHSPPEESNAPFPEASEAVVKAALTGSKVTDLGSESVRGQEATHYRIELTPRSTAALSALTPSQLARFELEYPGEVVGLEVWVADDLIRRISVRSDWETGDGTTIEFYDFGADITIRPPD